MDRAPEDRPQRWRVSLRSKGVAALAVPIVALFGALFAVYWLDADLQAADQMVVRTYEMRASLVDLHGALFSAQAAIAHLNVTGEKVFVTAFDAARRRTGEAQSRLQSYSVGDPGAASALAEIRRLTVPALEETGREARQVAMAELNTRITRLSEYERARFAEAQRQHDMARRRIFRTLIVCGVLGTLITLLVHMVVAGRVVRRLHILEENAHRLAHGLPLDPLPAGTDEIDALGRELESAAHLLRERERALRESEKRHRDLFDRAPVPYEETDANGTVRRVNQATCALLRCAPGDLIGKPAWALVASGTQDEFRAAMMERMASGQEAAPFECEYQFDDGTHITVEIRENLIRNARGKVTGAMRSLFDITERNLAAIAARKVAQYAMELRIKNEQLARALDGARAATTAKSRFLASVSHELRTPLNGIIGLSELLFDQKVGLLSAEQRDLLSDILASSRHLLHLIDDILDVSRVEAGRMEFRPERHRLHDLVVEVRDVVRPLAEKKGVALGLEVPDEVHATVDGARFKQVVYNYLSNAVKFTSEGGSISVRVRLEGNDRFRLEVEDTGVGIGDDELPRLFQEFGQLPSGRKSGQGIGLGLALTRQIIEAQGGVVGVDSRLGRGSTFFAVLPLEGVVKAPTS
ncbi:MAG TPA: ATP-binding protein [Candidatus Acidoferrum sp.]|nr:ATP-binding protein [Candidatus Acidoferrum sp.]